MNSEKRVNELLRSLKITDKQFITARATVSYLRSLLSAPCRIIHRALPKVVMLYESAPDSPIAYTDDVKIVLNGGHPHVKSCRTRAAKIHMLIGLMLHEFGHYRFTDMAGMNTAVKRIESGKFYPTFKKGDLSEELLENKAAFEAFLEEHPAHARLVGKEWHDIYNILEDAYIEECLYRTMTGVLIDGLTFVRKKMKATATPLSQMLDYIEEDPLNTLPVVRSLLLSYAKYGMVKCDYKNPVEASSEPMKWLKKCRRYSDALLYESRTEARVSGVNKVFLTLWPLIQPVLETMSPEDESAFEEALKKFSGSMGSEDPRGSSGKSSRKPVSVSEDEDTGKSGSSKTRKATSKAMEEADKEEGSEKDTPEEKMEDSGKDKSSAEKTSAGKDDSSTEGTGAEKPEGDAEDAGMTSVDIRPEGEDIVDDCSDEESYFEREEVGEDVDEEELSRSLAHLEKEVREDAAIDAASDELTEELRREATEMDYGSTHRNLKIKLDRITHVSDDTKEIYERECAGVERIADDMVRKVIPLIKKNSDQEKMAMSGFFSGPRFDATRLVYGDYRYFKQGISPAPDTRLAVSVLVDESGSMGCYDRISAARTAALALYLFCRKANIKCAVTGHTSTFSERGSLKLSSYADFETPDKDDKYRLLSISAKQDNRDGAAILFAGEHLLKREEPTKMLIIISDGAPCATGYSGPSAEADMTQITNELRRKGVLVFAAAIGSDKPVIQRIFGGGLLDITDLATLPDQLLQLVKRYIR